MWFIGQGITIEQVMMNILASLIIIFLVMPLHELAHGYLSYKLGDDTAKRQGKLRLNPLEQVDPWGAVFILLFNFGWAKPIPVDTRNFKKPRIYTALVSLAGPFSNLLAAFSGALLYNTLFLFRYSFSQNILALLELFLKSFIFINIGIAVFNLIPIPPLDGSKILEAFLPSRIRDRYYQNQGLFNILIMVLLFVGVLSGPIEILRIIVFNGIKFAANFIFGF